MSTKISDIIETLTKAEIYVFVKNGKLKTKCTKEKLTPDIVELIQRNKNTLVRHLSSHLVNGANEQIEIAPRYQRESVLSFSQQRLWLLDQIEGSSVQFNLARVLRMVGNFDIGILERCLTILVERHQSLRTVFKEVNGIPLQVVMEATEQVIPINNISDLEGEDREQRLQELIIEESQKPFDLSQDLMFRAHLICLAKDEHILLCTLHHIAFDGWSFGILMRELSMLYQVLVTNAANKGISEIENLLPQLPVQYTDYACWQREWFQGEVLAKQMYYWEQQLRDLPLVHNLPLDYVRPQIQRYVGKTFHSMIDQAATEALKTLCQRQGATLFMGLYAVFSTLLCRYSNETDIVIGTPIANREQPEIVNLIGYFVNTLILRTDLSKPLSFKQLLTQCQHTTLDAYEYQQIPFEELLEKLLPERSLSHNPLFQIMLVLQPVEQADINWPDLAVSFVEHDASTAICDLKLDAMETAAGLKLEWEFNTDLFEVSTIERMSAHFARLLSGLVAQPEENVFAIPMLSSAERSQVLEGYNATMRPRSESTVVELFESQVSRRPEAPAVIMGEMTVSYGELNVASNRLAHHLIEMGVGPESLIGVCLERSVELVVTLLAILKAGGAYVPLDPSYPEARLAYMLEDTSPEVVISTRGLKHHLPQEARVLELDTAQTQAILAQGLAHNPRDTDRLGTLSGRHPAYVIYTSGSTGQPKGVLIEHHALVNFTRAAVSAYDLSASDRVLQFASISFDAAAEELYPCLCCGATLVLRTGQMMYSTAAFIEATQVLNLTVWDLPTAYWHLIANELSSGHVALPESLRLVIIGGEQALPETVRQWHQDIGTPPKLINSYGPTEATVVATQCALTDGTADSTQVRKVSIGRPLDNVKVYVLDTYGQPVPIGVPGELYIGGAGVARGYLNRPELTSERFVADPFGESGSRMYRTGDLARWSSNGTLEFVGRADGQVKLRGFRIELDEIESVLVAHLSVAQAAVVMRDDGPAGQALVAYVVSASDAVLDRVGLEQSLANQLPAYMVPSAIVELDALPLTPNGKLDRRALPVPERQTETYRGPRTREEEVLCEAFAEVLGLERIGLDENFFALGGHSLLATRLVSRLRDSLGIEVAVRTLFEASTVAELARQLTFQDTLRPALVARPRAARLPLSPAQFRLWFIQKLEGPSATYNMPMALRLEGELNLEALQRALGDVVARHESLRTIFGEDQGAPYQQVLSLDEALAQVPVSVESVTEAELAGRLSQVMSWVIDLERELPLRAWVFRLSAQSHVVFMLMHHIASDGGSLAPLFRDLSQAYEARLGGAEPGYEPLPVQYGDYTLWQRELLGEVSDPESLLSQQLSYWQATLAGLPAEITLPTDRPRPAVSSYQGGTIRFEFSSPLHEGVRSMAQSSGATVFMVLQAAFVGLLARLGAGDDIAVGTPIAGRPESALEDLVGFFVNTLVLRTDVSGNPSFVELVGRVREVALRAYAQADVPFERVVEALNPERSLSRHPVFQVMFVLQNNAEAEMSMSGLSLGVEEIEGSISKFDLLLNLQERVGRDGEALGLVGELEYSTDLFNPETAQRLVERFERLLSSAVSSPEWPLHRLEVLSAAERHQVLEGFNATTIALPETTLAALFESQVARRPEAPAVIMGETTVSYGELNAEANRLAHHLIALGVEPECLVGVCLGRSEELVVALLAILKAGGAYVPLDPSYPQTRLAYMLEDASPSVVLSTEAFRDRLPHEVPVLELDTAGTRAVLAPLPIHNPSDADRLREVLPSHPAYVIYTSGSTGQPKGVVLPQATLLNLLLWHAAEAPASERVAQMTSVSFDVSLQELLYTLLGGKTLVLIDDDTRMHPERLASVLDETGVSEVFAPTIVLDHLAQAVLASLGTLVHLRHMYQAGEALTITPALQAFFSHHPQCQLHNHYGPSETHVVTSLELSSSPDSWPYRPSIGAAIQNTQMYVLGASLEPLPVGVSGELYISGMGLARGYLNRSELTAERFVANPYGEPGSRMYRTGDLARWNPDGTLQYIGRVDHQVKLRGFRIELGEIESVLVSQASVSQAAVVMRHDGPGEGELVAYVVPLVEQDVEIKGLQRVLSDQLPVYMVPSAVVVLEALPLTPNGKLDRRALPAPERQMGRYREPRTPQEQVLCEVFAKVLGLERVGVDEDFFALGGHSLLATRLVSQVRSVMGIEVPVRTLFEAPTVAALARQFNSEQSLRPALVARPRAARLPLSPAQFRLWFIQKLEGPSATYNMPMALRLEGELNLEALQRALGDVVARHESLRTIFGEDQGAPYQQVLSLDEALAQVPVSVESVTEAELAGRLSQVMSWVIDLERELPLRAWVFRLSAQSHVVFMLMHHIASDGGSLAPLFRDLSQAYEARLGGAEPGYEPLPVQYGDYTLWQRELLGEVSDPESLLSQQLSYWQATLAGLPAEITLPTDRPRPAVSSYQGGTIRFEFSSPLHEGVRSMAQSSGATVFMVLQAAFVGLLARLGAGDDIAVGTPIAGRPESALEDLVGFFVNTLVLRTDVSGNPSFVELVGRVREVALRAYAQADVPFERVVEALNPERSLSRHPVFQVMFVLQNNAEAEMSMSGLSLGVEEIEGSISKFDLLLNLQERVGRDGEALGLVGELEYSTDLFNPETAQRLVERFERLLSSAVSSPEWPLHRLEVLSAAERHQVLEGFNATTRSIPEATLVELFEAQVARTPEAPAVIMGETTVSYGELNAQANGLAHHLIELGVGPESLVGVCLERSIELVVTLLAILKAGGAYVPLDPSYPQARLAYTLKDAAPVVTISNQWTQGCLPETASVMALDMPETLAKLAQAPRHNPTDATRWAPLMAAHPAYVIYTSGSTGRPKGAPNTHEALVHRLLWMQETYRLEALDRLLLKTPYSFDVSVCEVFWPLLAGASLVVAPPEMHRDPDYLIRAITDHQITTLQFVPSMLNAFLAALDAPLDMNAPLRQVLCAGEALPGSLQAQFFRSLPEVALHNLYGPTEAAIYATAWACRDVDGANSPSIGSTIWNTRAYVLDAGLEPLPVGVSGELYISGMGLARGYLNRSELTAERFVANPYGEPGSRMYRTGDLARWNPDGTLQYIGRVDHQVKLRGFRIELGEIESAISSHAGVREAVVVVKEGDGDQCLVAYVVLVDAKEKTLVETLRAHLSEALPDYMVPSAFVTLSTLPLNPNGKVDRKALPEPDVSFNQSNYVAPVTALEEEICEMWASELKVERVGVMDDFFHLGGHSLLIISLMRRLYETLAVALPIAAIYQNANVRALAQYIQDMKTGSGSLVMQNQTLVCLQQGQPDKQPLFVIHPVGGDVFCYAPLLAELNLDCTVYGLQRRELTSQEEVTYQSIDTLAKNYLMQMQKVQKQGPYYILGWSLGGMIATKLAALLEEQGASVSYLGLIDTIDQSRNEELKSRLGLNSETLTAFKRFSESMNLNLDEFDQAFEVKSLLPFHRDLSLANLRELIYSGLIAALNFTLNRKVKNLYYYSATNTQISAPPMAIDNILALAEGSVQPRIIEGDHHSIMRSPSVRQLAYLIQQDLLNTVESDEQSAA